LTNRDIDVVDLFFDCDDGDDGVAQLKLMKASTTRLSVAMTDEELAKELQREEDEAASSSVIEVLDDSINSITESDAAIAERLQQEEIEYSETDIIALSDDDDEDRKPAAKVATSMLNFMQMPNTENDLLIAAEMQEDETEEYVQNKVDEEAFMQATTTGKAWKFVEKVLAMVERLYKEDPASAGIVQSVAVDDMVFTAERLLAAQEEFREAGKPTLVDLGYHYTRKENLGSIQTNGLMNMEERNAKSINPIQNNGASYGHGIYCAASPTAFVGSYGDTGLVVARLLGTNADYGAASDPKPDSITASRNTPAEFMVLATSKQCIPVLQYPSSQIVQGNDVNPGNVMVQKYHDALQTIIDDVFNQKVAVSTDDSQSPSARRVRPKHSIASPTLLATSFSLFASRAKQQQTKANTSPPFRRRAKSIRAARKKTAISATVDETLQYEAPTTLDASPNSCLWYICQEADYIVDDECAVCLDALELSDEAPVVELLSCGHFFHETCITSAIGLISVCPTCRTTLGNPQGHMPSGTMSVRLSPSDVCSGFEPAGCIVIDYNIPAAVQLVYHSNPGTQHNSAQRTAYLPDTDEGRSLLKRLKFAFQHGLTFTVGVSMASGQDNSVTWASIHHKTALSGGVQSHGFPDPNFFENCNNELDALCVPPADDL
jgi:deltex